MQYVATCKLNSKKVISGYKTHYMTINNGVLKPVSDYQEPFFGTVLNH